MPCLQQNNRNNCAYNIQRSYRQKKTSSGDLQDVMWIGYKHKKGTQRANIMEGGWELLSLYMLVQTERKRKNNFLTELLNL